MMRAKIGDMVRLSHVGTTTLSPVRTDEESAALRKHLHSVGTVVSQISETRYIIGFTGEGIEFKCMRFEFENLSCQDLG